LVAFRDVTAQRTAEEALKRAEERWQFAIDGAREGVWDYDEDTQKMFFSRRWKEMIGYEEGEIGSAVTEWTGRIHPDDKRRVMQAVVDYRQGVTAAYETEHRLRHKLGHWIWVLDRGKIVDPAGWWARRLTSRR
jgi:PAS domain S-box-containing protein